MIQARDLLDLGKKDLLAMLCTGHPIDPHALDDKEYRGTSLGLPAWVERLTWKKFKKVFHRDRATGALRGWNVRLEQNELDGPCVPKQKRGRTVTFGHYRVVESASVRMPIECPQALIIHYGLGNNARLDPVRRVRDPLVALEAGSVQLLLGWSYVDLGLGLLGTPSFFSLELDGELSDIV
ncbi:MAG: hypothetical protein KC776_04755 [Myxococcales bacterium]|nr:hypothetical protein [Myxococcales bacterium]MCB9579060.1 hypothetical protein [Polyangiaceae bacterium]